MFVNFHHLVTNGLNRKSDALIINREGNFNTILAQNRNALGTVWNAWQTQWSGVSTTTRTFRDTSFHSVTFCIMVVRLLQELKQQEQVDRQDRVLIRVVLV